MRAILDWWRKPIAQVVLTAPLDVSELFYSRTDHRGVIQAGNGIFRRVSGYEWASLRGAPHRLIRHPDMPKAVFHRMWHDLQSGATFAGYIKNRTRDGRFYWVFAISTPVEDGYMSVRIKATSARLAEVCSLYADLKQSETAGQSPADGAQSLEENVQSLGFSSYTDFAAHSLITEVTARASALGQDVPQPLLAWSGFAWAAQAAVPEEIRLPRMLLHAGAAVIETEMAQRYGRQTIKGTKGLNVAGEIRLLLTDATQHRINAQAILAEIRDSLPADLRALSPEAEVLHPGLPDPHPITALGQNRVSDIT